MQESINTRKGVERCLRYAFEYTRKRNRRKTLTLCGKTNVLTYAFDLWERAFNEVGAGDYPDIKRDYAHVDATCMWMVKNPEWFDVIVTDNMFGDIITDLGAMIQGGMGIAAGGNINPGDGLDVRADRRLGARSTPARTSSIPMAAIAAGADDARTTSARPTPPTRVDTRDRARASQEAEVDAGRQDGLLDVAGRRPRRRRRRHTVRTRAAGGRRATAGRRPGHSHETRFVGTSW